MPQVSVTPESFEMVFYDAAVIGEVISEVAERLGVEETITLEIDEASPLGRSKITSYDPIELWVDGGALENTQRPPIWRGSISRHYWKAAPADTGSAIGTVQRNTR